MTLSAGSQIGPYQILELLGAGGMGEVYRARDPRLGRDVAIKVLPAAFSDDVERLRRFQQEARAAAALNHPHILAVYDIGTDSGAPFIVSELLEGETLRERVRSGPLAVRKAIELALQIAHGLAAAHNKGIIHRDLKPENVFITRDHRAKILDFGLAKLTEDQPSRDAASAMATVTASTQPGLVLGTVGYMAPEQVRGGTVDHRADLFAFGAVLYELLSRHRAFSRATVPETLTAILNEDPPDLSRATTPIPPALVRIVDRCLDKSPSGRFQTAADLAFALEGLSDGSGATAAPKSTLPETRRASRAWLGWGAAAVVVAALLVGGYARARLQPTMPRVVRLSLPQPAGSVLTASSTIDQSATPDLAFTPDGSQLVYVGNVGTQLFVRSLDALEPRRVASGIQLRNPFVSPRGDWVAYADRRFVLKKVSITGGPSIPLPARLDTDLAGATWLPDDTIIFATFGETLGLRRTTAEAGTPGEASETLTRPNAEKGERNHLWPEALPGGQAVLFTITYRTGGLGTAQVWVLDLQSRAQKSLIVGGSGARFIPGASGATSGHLVYAAEGGLRAIPFDSASLTTIGAPVSVMSRVATTARGAADFAVAPDGTMAYVNPPDPGPTTLAWVDREGREEPIVAPPHRYEWVRAAPDGTRLAVGYRDSDLDVAIWDIRRATLMPLRFASTERANGPVWTPDSSRIIVQAALPNGPSNLWWAAADGSDTAERLTTSSNTQRPTGVSPDGKHIVLMEARGSLDVMQLALDRTRRVTPLIDEAASFDAGAVVSPDGRWLAYESDVSGQMEIYVCPYPAVRTSSVRVSQMGGMAPRWLPKTGGELFFVSPDGAFMRVSVETTSRTWQAGPPTKVRQLEGYGTGSSYGPYDIAPDGRIVVIKGSVPPPEVVLVLNWNRELARLAPAR